MSTPATELIEACEALDRLAELCIEAKDVAEGGGARLRTIQELIHLLAFEIAIALGKIARGDDLNGGAAPGLFPADD